MRRVEATLVKLKDGKIEEELIKGQFHKWGESYEEFEEGPGNQTMAIIELDDGRVVEAYPNRVKFLKPKKSLLDYARETIDLALSHAPNCGCDCMDHSGMAKEAKDKLGGVS